MRRFIVGTRGSALALWQTRHVTALVQRQHAFIEERIITTQGDTNLSDKLVGKLEKGFFTQELEAALHEGDDERRDQVADVVQRCFLPAGGGRTHTVH